MLVTMYPGANRDDVLRALRKIESDAHDVPTSLQFAGKMGYNYVIRYLDWAAKAVQMLERLVSAADIDRLVLTCGYERLLSAAKLGSASGDTQEVLSAMVDHELHQRTESLQEAIKDLRAQIRRWPPNASYIVADTSVYIEHDDKLEALDFATLLDGRPDKPIVLIVPVIILDELDGLKNRGPDPWRKWRAGYTIGVFERVFARIGSSGILREAGPARGAISVDVLFDPSRHQRLLINDDEIIDRTLAAQGLAGKPVTLLTFDTSQAVRARQARLTVVKLSKPIGDEPEDSRRRKRKQQSAANGQSA